jgi:hypothetical protein
MDACTYFSVCYSSRDLKIACLRIIYLRIKKERNSETITYLFYCCDGVRLCFCGSEPLMDPLSIPQTIHDWVWNRGEILTGKTEGVEKKSQCYSVHHKSHADYPAQTLASTVWSRRLTAWAMPRPQHIFLMILKGSKITMYQRSGSVSNCQTLSNVIYILNRPEPITGFAKVTQTVLAREIPCCQTGREAFHSPPTPLQADLITESNSYPDWITRGLFHCFHTNDKRTERRSNCIREFNRSNLRRVTLYPDWVQIKFFILKFCVASK